MRMGPNAPFPSFCELLMMQRPERALDEDESDEDNAKVLVEACKMLDGSGNGLALYAGTV